MGAFEQTGEYPTINESRFPERMLKFAGELYESDSVETDIEYVPESLNEGTILFTPTKNELASEIRSVVSGGKRKLSKALNGVFKTLKESAKAHLTRFAHESITQFTNDRVRLVLVDIDKKAFEEYLKDNFNIGRVFSLQRPFVFSGRIRTEAGKVVDVTFEVVASPKSYLEQVLTIKTDEIGSTTIEIASVYEIVILLNKLFENEILSGLIEAYVRAYMDRVKSILNKMGLDVKESEYKNTVEAILDKSADELVQILADKKHFGPSLLVGNAAGVAADFVDALYQLAPNQFPIYFSVYDKKTGKRIKDTFVLYPLAPKGKEAFGTMPADKAFEELRKSYLGESTFFDERILKFSGEI